MAIALSETDSKITQPIKDKFAEREATFDFLTNSAGEPEKGITPISMKFTDGKTEQRGMRLSLDGKPPAPGDLNIIFCTHHNETAILDGIKIVLETFRKNPEAFQGRGVNLLLGGQKERCKKFFQRIQEDKQGFISAVELESFRNSTQDVNCNRVPRDPIVPPDCTPGSLGWLQQIHDFYDLHYYGSSRSGSPMTITLDGHTTSNPSDPLTVFFDRPPEQAEELKTLGAYTGAGTVMSELTNTNPTLYMCESKQKTPNKLGFVYESRKHMDLDAGTAAERAIVGLLAYLGIHVPGYDLPASQAVTFYHDTSLLYTPGSSNAKRNPPGTVPEMAGPGRWEGDVQLINSLDDVRPEIRDYFASRDVIIKPPKDGLKNGADVCKGDHIALAHYRHDSGELEHVLLTAPKDGVSFMAPQKSLIDGKFPDSFVELLERDQVAEVPLSKPETRDLPLIFVRKEHPRIKQPSPGVQGRGM